MTSYDYDALLTEAGEPTEKYFHVQRAIKEVCPEVWQAEPRRKTFGSLGTFPVQNSVSLLAVKDQMMTAQETMYPITMEEAESGYGYMLYSVNLKNYHHENKLKVVEASDRLHLLQTVACRQFNIKKTLGKK